MKNKSLTCLPSGLFAFMIKSPPGHSDLKISPAQCKTSQYKKKWVRMTLTKGFLTTVFLFSPGTCEHSGSTGIHWIHPSFKSWDLQAQWTRNESLLLPSPGLHENQDAIWGTGCVLLFTQISGPHEKSFQSYRNYQKVQSEFSYLRFVIISARIWSLLLFRNVQ